VFQHLVIRHAPDGAPSDGRLVGQTAAYLTTLGLQGWQLVSTAVLVDGALLLFFRRYLDAPPTSYNIDIPPELEVTFL
jgi:hypothetical protein